MNKWWVVFCVLVAGCSPASDSSEALDKLPVLRDLQGREFFVPSFTSQQKIQLDSNLLTARQKFEKDPSEENYIWYGRRLAYRYHLSRAIEIFSEGIEKYPESYRLYRHRGHRYLSIREIDKAIADFKKASQLMEGKPIEIEPDGIPNALNTPLSSTQFNVWYHLGLCHYLKGDYEEAKSAYFNAMSVSNNNDLLVASLDWLYMTYQRQGKREAADSLLVYVTEETTVIENDSYLNRLRMYKGEMQPEQVLSPDSNTSDYDLALATQGYGVGNWYLYHGDTAKAKEIFKRVLDGKQFTAFGFIAAESDYIWLNDCKDASSDFCLQKLAKMKALARQ